MKKRILMTLVMVVMVLGLSIMMVSPVLASQITATKDVTDPFQPNIYYVGDTIYYEMTVSNHLATPRPIRWWRFGTPCRTVQYTTSSSQGWTRLLFRGRMLWPIST